MKQKHLLSIRHNCGFFSDFLTSLAGIMWCYDNNHDFYVDWRNPFYNYENQCNLFDKYFYQKLDGNTNFDRIHHTLTPYEYYFALVDHYENEKYVEMFKHPAEIIKNLNILNNEHFKSIDTSFFENKKVLGIHKRGTDHIAHGRILSDYYFLNEINEEFKKNSYDKIFLITDDITSFNFFKKELGDSLITTDSFKTTGYSGIHLSRQNGHKISVEVIRDSFLLSKTDFKMVTKSNVSTFSLLCNLDKNNFRYIDKHISYA